MADKARENPDVREVDENPDPLTGEHGSHPIGTGVGAAGAGAAGAAIGAMGGPIGAAVGAVIGAVAGGLAGKGIAEAIDPTVEEAHWRETYPTRPYYDEKVEYDEYAPAYRYGWETRSRLHDRSWDEVEPTMEREWTTARGESSLEWERARPATRDAWDRVERMYPAQAPHER